MKTKQKRVADKRRAEKMRQQQDLIDSLRTRVELADQANGNLRRTNGELESAKSAALSEQRRLSTALDIATRGLDRQITDNKHADEMVADLSKTCITLREQAQTLSETLARLEKDNDFQREQLEKVPARTRINMHGVSITVESKDQEL